MRDGLLHAAACRASSHLVYPTFGRLLRAADFCLSLHQTLHSFVK